MRALLLRHDAQTEARSRSTQAGTFLCSGWTRATEVPESVATQCTVYCSQTKKQGEDFHSVILHRGWQKIVMLTSAVRINVAPAWANISSLANVSFWVPVTELSLTTRAFPENSTIKVLEISPHTMRLRFFCITFELKVTLFLELLTMCCICQISTLIKLWVPCQNFFHFTKIPNILCSCSSNVLCAPPLCKCSVTVIGDEWGFSVKLCHWKWLFNIIMISSNKEIILQSQAYK